MPLPVCFLKDSLQVLSSFLEELLLRVHSMGESSTLWACSMRILEALPKHSEEASSAEGGPPQVATSSGATPAGCPDASTTWVCGFALEDIHLLGQGLARNVRHRAIKIDTRQSNIRALISHLSSRASPSSLASRVAASLRLEVGFLHRLILTMARPSFICSSLACSQGGGSGENLFGFGSGGSAAPGNLVANTCRALLQFMSLSLSLSLSLSFSLLSLSRQIDG